MHHKFSHTLSFPNLKSRTLDFLTHGSNCTVLNVLSSRIAAVPTSASSELAGFKAHTVFKEIEKKLAEVIHQNGLCVSNYNIKGSL